MRVIRVPANLRTCIAIVTSRMKEASSRARTSAVVQRRMMREAASLVVASPNPSLLLYRPIKDCPHNLRKLPWSEGEFNLSTSVLSYEATGLRNHSFT